nr:hypothetical protein CFP56_60900 [Quercus suber]
MILSIYCSLHKRTQYRIDKAFLVYALGISKPEFDSVVNSGDPIADPIWDAMKEEAKLEGWTFHHNVRGKWFYGYRHWKPGSNEHCKSFKWFDGIPCRSGAEIIPIVIAKFIRLEAEAAMAKNNEKEARAMIVDILHRERVAKCSAKKARVSLHMANAQARKYQIALLMSWFLVVVLFIFSLGNKEAGLRQMYLP